MEALIALQHYLFDVNIQFGVVVSDFNSILVMNGVILKVDYFQVSVQLELFKDTKDLVTFDIILTTLNIL